MEAPSTVEAKAGAVRIFSRRLGDGQLAAVRCYTAAESKEARRRGYQRTSRNDWRRRVNEADATGRGWIIRDAAKEFETAPTAGYGQIK